MSLNLRQERSFNAERRGQRYLGFFLRKDVCCSDDGKLDTRPPMLVTASVDAIQLRKRLAIETDMTVHGQVVWTGSSSMDIRMELLQVSLTSIATRTVCTIL